MILLLVSCKSTKFVPNDRYLLQKNKIDITGKELSEEELIAFVRQQPNKKMVGLKWDLFLFNHFDSLKIADKRSRKNIKIRFKNEQSKLKENKINSKRIAKAKAKGDNFYRQKKISLKDTIEPNLFLKEWLKYKVGERPVIFDSLQYSKSLEQIKAYLNKKGYYYGNCEGKIRYKKNQKVVVSYQVNPGKKYVIDSVYVECSDNNVLEGYTKHQKKHKNTLIGQPFDVDNLDNYRISLARYLKDEALYGYSPSLILYTVDTNKLKMSVTLGIIFKDRMIASKSNKDSLVPIKFEKTYVNNVNFHILDTNHFEGNFKEKVSDLGLSLSGRYLPTIDTLCYNLIKKKNSNEVDSSRLVNFLYNGKLFLDPEIMEVQSLLEKNNEITETNIENTYIRLQQMDLFQTVKIELDPLIESNKMNVNYYLIPSKKQIFGAQARVTNTNGYFGLSAGLNYANKNVFKGAEKLTLAVNSSLQSQPPIIDEKIDNKDLKELTTKFYQFEIGPSLKYEFPGILFLRNTKLNKSRLAKSTINSAYSFQIRDLYTKENFQLNYSFRYEIRNTQSIQMGLPGLSVIKFVSIIKSNAFESYLKQKNNPFLSNTFSNQFIWQDWKISFEYRDKEKASKTRNSSFYYLGTFDLAGNLLSAFKKYQKQDTLGLYLGQYRVNGLVYSQFSRLDNTLIYTIPISKTKSINTRALIGMGLTYGNSKTSMPYDYSFYAGGANDVRGWRASSLGPGSYKYYIDTNGTNIQVGDIRLASSAEYRFQFNKKFKGALFVDAGNIWTVRTDNNRTGSKFSQNWYKEIAVAPGIGFRRDFDYFIVRVDIGFPIHNPALPTGERWVFQNQTNYNKEVNDFLINNPKMSSDALKKIDATPFSPNISFGIGYPF